MLTNFVYDIQLKREKTTLWVEVVFLCEYI
jgi:hypothetical protein